MNSMTLGRRNSGKVHLDDLIRDQNWDSVREAINVPDKRSRSSPSKIACSRRCSSSPLALAVSFNPPSDVVSSLIQLDPSATICPDRRGRLPIHVACSTGASIDVVHHLLALDSISANGDENVPGECNLNFALRADADFRLPLHYAAEYATGSYGDTIDVVAVLCTACPEAATTRDGWGETPGDLAGDMEEAASLDGDSEMVEAARAVQRVLLQTPMLRWKRRSARLGTKEEGSSCRRSVQGRRRDICRTDRAAKRELYSASTNDSMDVPRIAVLLNEEGSTAPKPRIFRRNRRKVNSI